MLIGRQFGEALDLVGGEQVALGVDRVGGEIEAERVALGGHALGQGPAGVGRKADRRDRVRAAAAEQAVLAAGPLVVGRGGMGEDGLGRGMDRRAVALRIVSNAPAAARLSSWRRLSRRGSTRAANSSRLANGPLAARSATSDSIAFSPTPLSAPSA